MIVRRLINRVVKSGLTAVLGLGVAMALLPGTAAAAPDGPDGPLPGPHSPADLLRLNELQFIGTHNSYHREPTPAEKAIRAEANPAGESGLEYSHAPIDQQLGGQQVRKVELDVFADPDGGRYAEPLLRGLAGEPAYDPVMTEPGTKILHIQDVDYHSTCRTLVACLTEVKEWSDANAGHAPIAIQLEFKDQPATFPGLSLVEPIRWTHDLMLGLDAEIRSVFDDGQMITPDDVRLPGMTLEQSILTKGWPTLGESRGKVMFMMDNAGRYRQEYLVDSPSLENRVMFTNSSQPGRPDSAFMLRNDPTGANLADIQNLVARGYLVRTRADLPTYHVRANDTSMREAALASGAQWIDTDFPVPGMAARYGSDYYAALPTGTPARCNPITAPVYCDPKWLDLAGTGSAGSAPVA